MGLHIGVAGDIRRISSGLARSTANPSNGVPLNCNPPRPIKMRSILLMAMSEYLSWGLNCIDRTYFGPVEGSGPVGALSDMAWRIACAPADKVSGAHMYGGFSAGEASGKSLAVRGWKDTGAFKVCWRLICMYIHVIITCISLYISIYVCVYLWGVIILA